MNKQKLHVFFRRVSTTNQDLSMQVEYDRHYRENLSGGVIYEINEDGVSANKLSIEERPKMLELISLIKKDKVDTLYAYDRTRLVRNMYDAMQFNDLCQLHQIKIVYTSTENGHMAYTNNNLLECILYIFGDIEGKNIARRTKEAHRRYPPKKFGYIKNKEDKTYKKDESKQAMLEEFFQELKQVQSHEEMKKHILSYKDIFKRSEEQILKIAVDPFYAGLDLDQGKSELPYVDSYLTKDDYFAIQDRIYEHITEYADKLKQIKKTVFPAQPKCGHCHKSLKLKLKHDRSDSYYTCITKHSKRPVEFTSTDLKEALEMAVYQVIGNLDVDGLMSQSKKHIKYIRDEVGKEVKKLQQQIKTIEDELLFSTKEYQQNWKQNDSAKSLTLLEEEKYSLEKKLTEKEWLLNQNKEMVIEIEQALLNQASINIDLLKELLIQEIVLFDDHIEVRVYNFKYLKDMDKQLIHRKGEPACK